MTVAAVFIDSNAARFTCTTYPEYRLGVWDKLTCAGDLKKLEDISALENFAFVGGDIADTAVVTQIFSTCAVDSVMHLAAEAHADLANENPRVFVQTNVVGAVTWLNAARGAWGEHADRQKHLFYHTATDEVYGSLGAEGLFTETTAYDPRSPYSASKTASDHFVRVSHHTCGLSLVISNCSNKYGPIQYPEKRIPVVIRQMLERKPIPVYGKGENIRDWLFVGDHIAATDVIFHTGKSGETCDVGGDNEWKNSDLVTKWYAIVDVQLERPVGNALEIITFVADRKTHDLRYAIDASKLKNELNWEPKKQFDAYLSEMVDYYLNFFKHA